MKYLLSTSTVICPVLLLCLLTSCKHKDQGPSKELISQINLKRGSVITCGNPDKQFGAVDFEMSCGNKSKSDFNLAIEMLHSFEYDESEKVFAKIIDENPGCGMAYWGVAMCNFHPLWTPPTEAELQKGSKAIDIAKSITTLSKRESAYISAIAVFYKDWDKKDHHIRCLAYEKEMEKLNSAFPEDKEAAIFYALALDASADPNDKTFVNQIKAGKILNALYPSEPNHPGIIHYIIHTYDYPGLAELALPAARKYAQIAPSSAHALHMPCICPRIFLPGWGFGMTALNQIWYQPNLQNVMQNRQASRDIGMKSCMVWTTSYMPICKKATINWPENNCPTYKLSNM